MLYSALFDGAIGVGGVLESLLSLQPISNAAKIAVANMLRIMICTSSVCFFLYLLESLIFLKKINCDIVLVKLTLY